MPKVSVPNKLTPVEKRPSLWSRFDTHRLQHLSANAPHRTFTHTNAASVRRFRWFVDAAIPVALVTIAGIAVLLPSSLPAPARIALFAFLVATILWSTTSINADYIALTTMLFLVLAGGVPQDQLFNALASDVVWLMIGAFVLGGAVQKTGLASRCGLPRIAV